MKDSNTIAEIARVLLRPLLSRPSPKSLELIAKSGEIEEYKEKGKRYFVYELLTKRGKRYVKNFDEYKTPTLPGLGDGLEEVGETTFRGILRDLLYSQPRYTQEIKEELVMALNISEIKQQKIGASIFGIDPSDLRTELYVLASTQKEAQEKIKAYASKVTEILQKRNLYCPLKIRPKLKNI